MSGILRLESLTKGNTLKQGDKTPLKYKLFDADGEKLNIAGKSAKARLVYPDFLTIGYEMGGLTVAQDDTVTFMIDKVIPAMLYHVEIIVDDKFIFPSRADESKFTVDKSSLGTEASIIEIIGKDTIIREVIQQLESVDASKHISNKNNPHSVTKAQIGLGSVQNYGIATQVEAQSGISGAKYMTPQRTKEAIEALGVRKYSTNIGNNTAKSFTINHGLGTTDVVISTYLDNEEILPAMRKVVNANSVQVDFATVWGTNKIKVVILG